MNLLGEHWQSGFINAVTKRPDGFKQVWNPNCWYKQRLRLQQQVQYSTIANGVWVLVRGRYYNRCQNNCQGLQVFINRWHQSCSWLVATKSCLMVSWFCKLGYDEQFLMSQLLAVAIYQLLICLEVGITNNFQFSSIWPSTNAWNTKI